MLGSMLRSVYNCIWKRPKSVELTMEVEKFGINVTQLKIKK